MRVTIGANASALETGGRPISEAATARTLAWILVSAAGYYLATRIAWLLSFPDSKVSLFSFPNAILVSVLLLVPTRHWWAYTFSAVLAHFIATQQEQWPLLFSLQCGAFDAAKVLLTAAGIRMFIKSPFALIRLREAIIFVLIAVVIVSFGTAFWGAAISIANIPGTDYWTSWRRLSVSNGVTTVVLVPVILIGAHLFRKGIRITRGRLLEASLLAACILLVGWFTFDRQPAAPDTSPALLYAFIPLLVWAALRFGLGGTCAAVLVITMLAISGTMQGRGPFLMQSPVENVMALQLFILMAAAPLILLAVAIEEERRSKEALRVSDERMSLTAQSAQLALWDWDVANDLVWIQDEGLFGFDPTVPIDHSTLAGSVHPDDRAARTAAYQRALATGGIYESEFRIRLADGSVRWLAVRGRSASASIDGARPRFLGVAFDVTSQKQAGVEAQLQREELAHLSRVATLNTLSSSIAHELSQPLSSIHMNAQAGQLGMAKSPPDLSELGDILTDIVDAESRAGEIIERMRALLRRGPSALQSVNVHECLDELLRLTRSDLIAHGVSVSNQTTPDLPLARTDRVQLQQVLLNLIRNACEAMHANPPQDRTLTLTTSIANSEVNIGVLDCGIGLPHDIEAIFQPFHSTKPGGLGMGLSICRTLVTAQGGRLWAERRAERGAAFYVALPLAAASLRNLS